MMRVVHFDYPKKKAIKKPTEKEIIRQKALEYVFSQRAKDAKKTLSILSKEIEAIREKNPDFLNARQVQI